MVKFLAILISAVFLISPVSIADEEHSNVVDKGHEGGPSKKEKGEYFWGWAKNNPECAKELLEIYKHHPKWRDEMRGTDKEDAAKMIWIMENAEKHPKIAEAMFEWADNHPLKTAWLWNHPGAAKWTINHPGAAEFLKNHPGLAHRFKNHAEVAHFLKNHPEIKDRVGERVEKSGERREDRGERLEKRGEEIGGKRGEALEKKGERMQNQGEKMQKHGEKMKHK